MTESVYSLRSYGYMTGDSARFEGYKRAIAKAVRHGDTVAEIGCGPGVLSFLACRAGAKRVYAIESDDIIHLAKKLAAANNFSDRIEFFHGNSLNTELPERVNVLVSDLRGVLPLYDGAVRSIQDARARFLSPNGILIPQCDVVRVAAVELDAFYRGLVAPWTDTVADVDMSASLNLVLNDLHTLNVNREGVISTSETLCTLDYAAGVTAHACAELNLAALRSGTGHGLCAWFDAHLLDEIGFSSAPGSNDNVYGQLFMPWLGPVRLSEGQEIRVAIHADLVGKDYIWRWETEIVPLDGSPKIHFRQSSFEGTTISPESLRKRATDYVPVLSENGRMDRWILEAIDGTASLQQIAEKAAEQFPALYPSWNDAFERVIELAAKYSR